MFILAVGNDKIWRMFCKAIGRPELTDDPRFRTNPDRVKNQDELEKILQGIFLTRDRDDWVSLLLSNGIPAGPIYNMADLARDNYVNRYVLAEIRHPELGVVRLVRNPPIRFNGEPTDVRFIEY